MSNPFRRTGSNTTPSSRPEASGTPAVPLSVNTRVPTSSQKHVNFASPPAIPISPASYPSSPESTRQSPGFRAALPVSPDYSEAIQVDPFQTSAFPDVDDVAIEQALQNARTNSEITTSRAVQRDAVNSALSRFASGPKKPLTVPETPVAPVQAKPQKQALDVDAFKRLLLTGDTGPSASQTTGSGTSTSQLASDSGSSADTASLSQRSVSENVPPTIEETPRSSMEQERSEADLQKTQGQEGRRKPPTPKPRYGKPISGPTKRDSTESVSRTVSHTEPVPSTTSVQEATASAEPSDPIPVPSAGLDPSDVKKRPPTPPLTRRKSQKAAAAVVSRPGITRNPSSRYSINSSSDDAPTPAPGTPGKMPPPPPPMRRMDSHSSRKASGDLPATMEEESDADAASIDRLPASSKRTSLNPPPLPPPRGRNRGSSRSSVDNTPPSMGQLGMTNLGRSNGEYERSSDASTESRNVSGASNATDILADLAALQREVDAARAQPDKR